MPASSPGERLVSPAFVLIAIVVWLDFMAFHMYLNLASVIESLGATTLLIGAAVGTTQLVRALVGPYFGRLADRTGHRTLLALGSAVQALACALYLTADVVGPWLFAIRVLHGVAAALIFCTIDAYIVTVIPPAQQARGLSMYTAIALAASTAGSILGEQVLDRMGSDWFFGISCAVGALAVPFAMALRRRPIPVASRSFLGILSCRPLRPIWLLFFVFSFVVALINTFLPTYLAAIQAGSLGMFYAARTGVSIIVKLVFGGVADRRGPVFPFTLGLAAEATALLVLASADSTALVAVSAVISGVGWGLAFPQFFTLTARRSPAGELGTAMAVQTSFSFLGEFAGSNAWGLAVDLSSYRIAYCAGAGLLVLCLAIAPTALRAPPASRPVL